MDHALAVVPGAAPVYEQFERYEKNVRLPEIEPSGKFFALPILGACVAALVCFILLGLEPIFIFLSMIGVVIGSMTIWMMAGVEPRTRVLTYENAKVVLAQEEAKLQELVFPLVAAHMNPDRSVNVLYTDGLERRLIRDIPPERWTPGPYDAPFMKVLWGSPLTGMSKHTVPRIATIRLGARFVLPTPLPQPRAEMLTQ
jgi:hypothetical protein